MVAHVDWAQYAIMDVVKWDIGWVTVQKLNGIEERMYKEQDQEPLNLQHPKADLLLPTQYSETGISRNLKLEIESTI